MARGGAHARSAAPPAAGAVVLRYRLLLDGQQQGFEERATMLDKPAPAVRARRHDRPDCFASRAMTERVH
jgi:hypothetical protein